MPSAITRTANTPSLNVRTQIPSSQPLILRHAAPACATSAHPRYLPAPPTALQSVSVNGDEQRPSLLGRTEEEITMSVPDRWNPSTWGKPGKVVICTRSGGALDPTTANALKEGGL